MAALRAAIASTLALPASTLPATAQDAGAEIFKGKQNSILVGFSPGGNSSLYAQALTRVMGRHLPGNPVVIVQHMPGAGGLTVINHLVANAPRDGTVLATTSRTFALEPLLGNKNARFDTLKLTWLGTANVEATTCILWHTAPAKTLAEAMQHEVIVGGTGAEASEVVFSRAANKLNGTKFKVVLGYPGSTEMLLAMERQETQGFCGIGWTFVKMRKGYWLRDKKINIVFQMGLAKHPELPDVPSIMEHAKTPEDRQVWEFLLAPQEFGRPFVGPPDLPPERTKLLRDAFEKSLKDPAYLAEAEKLGIEVQHRGGEQIKQLLERVYQTPKAIIDRAKSISE